MRKKLLIGFGLASSLALAVAFATDKAPAVSTEKEAQKATIVAESKGHPCHKAEGSCLKKSSTAEAKPSGDQNVASSGIDCPKSADCPKTDCDKSKCLKKSGSKAKAESPASGEATGAETEI